MISFLAGSLIFPTDWDTAALHTYSTMFICHHSNGATFLIVHYAGNTIKKDTYLYSCLNMHLTPASIPWPLWELCESIFWKDCHDPVFSVFHCLSWLHWFQLFPISPVTPWPPVHLHFIPLSVPLVLKSWFCVVFVGLLFAHQEVIQKFKEMVRNTRVVRLPDYLFRKMTTFFKFYHEN